MTWVVGILIIAFAVYAILRQVDVRLALFLAAVLLGFLGRDFPLIIRTFLATLTNEQFVVPICCAMGFAYVLRQTGCDQHLIYLLLRPLRRARPFLIPGSVLVGFLINIPIVSQTSTAVTLGSVLVPLLLAAGFSHVTVGATLLLGCSIGGELLNPGAPEFQTVVNALRPHTDPHTPVQATQCVEAVFPLVIPHLVVATVVFWWSTIGAERRHDKHLKATPQPASDATAAFRVSAIKALIPLLPITLLFLAGRPLQLIHVPQEWLINPANPAEISRFDSRMIGAAMLIGVAAAALTAGRAALRSAAAFFEGAGYAFTHIISVIVTANCFGKGVELSGLARRLGDCLSFWPGLLIPSATALPLTFAWVSGSGMASTQSLYGFFVPPAFQLRADPIHVGAVVSIAAAAGRTMSPVAAVTLMCATLTGANPFDLIRRIAIPLLLGICVMLVFAILPVHTG